MSQEPVILKIFKYDPAKDHAPYYKNYKIPWQEGLLLLPAVKYVRDIMDETLAFRDYSAGAHGACPAL